MSRIPHVTASPVRPQPTGGLLAVAALALALAAPAAAQEDFATCWEHYEASRWKQAVSCFEGLMAEFDGWAWRHGLPAGRDVA